MPLLHAIQRADATAIALIEGDRAIRYGELVDLVGRTAAGLVQRGVAAGARVAVAGPTGIDTVVAYLAVQGAGAIAAMVNCQAPRAEIESRLGLIDPALVLVSGSPLDLGAESSMARPAGCTSNDLPLLDSPAPAKIEVDERAAAVILFTSGVAAAPRIVTLTHTNLAAVQTGLIQQSNSDLGSATVALGAVSFAHVFGLNSMLGPMLRIGASTVLLDPFDARAALALITKHNITAVSAVPQMWAMLAAAGGVPDNAMASVRRATSSAAHLPAATAALVDHRFGVKVAAGYGMTESSGTVLLDDVAAPTPGTVGRPLGATEVRVVDLGGTDVEPGDRGEIWLRGPSVFSGYLNEDTPFEPGGWFRTGDVAIVDERGRFAIVDRIKDVVIVSGFNVSPTEVEAALVSHPEVAAAVVIGEPDDRTGERIVAFVKPSGDARPDPAELQAHCRRRLARYKVPVRIEWRHELPATDTGKALRRLLR